MNTCKRICGLLDLISDLPVHTCRARAREAEVLRNAGSAGIVPSQPCARPASTPSRPYLREAQSRLIPPQSEPFATACLQDGVTLALGGLLFDQDTWQHPLFVA